MVHGDAWAATRCRPPGGGWPGEAGPAEVILIDWECGGLGVPVLDFGNCLLEGLLDAVPPDAGPAAWNVQPGRGPDRGGGGGIREPRRALSAGERAVLLPAIRFGAAYVGAIHFEQALAEGVRGAAMDARLERLRNRLAVSETVARLAAASSRR